MNAAHHALLAQRWPALLARLEAAPPASLFALEGTPAPALSVDGIQLGSAYDPRAEAELQARLVPERADRATVYGVGNGELVRRLLARPGLTRLDVVVLSPAACAASLAHHDHRDWLSDERVRLLDGAGQAELAFPFAVSPAALRLAAEGAERLRDLLELELGAVHVERRRDARASEFAARLAENEARVARDGDVARLFGTHVGGTALVAAAGPTLAQHYERLRGRGAGELLIAVDAALRPLLDAGVRPDVVVAMDFAESSLSRLLEVTPAEATGTALVYEPLVPPRVLDAWPGERLAAYGRHARFDALAARHPRGRLWSAGSVLHSAVDLAVQAGAARVDLLGADFALLGGASHVAGCPWRTELQPGARPTVRNGHGVPVPTLPNLRGYLRDLERYVAEHPAVRFVNTSLDGAHIQGTASAETAHA